MTTTHEARMAYVDQRMKAIGKLRVQKAQLVAREGGPDLISGALLIAIALRESGGRNVLGDHGHARGAFQITDWYHREWLRSVPGCLAATTIPEATRINWLRVPGSNAAMRGFAPTWEDGARYTARLLSEAVDPEQNWSIGISVAAFNCGFKRAVDGWRAGDVDMHTTGGDYSADVLLRRSEVNTWLREHPGWKA